MTRRLALLVVCVWSCTGSTPPGTKCGSDAECSGGQVCLDGTCQPACSPDRPCSAGQVCRDGVCQPANQCGGAACTPQETCVDDVCYPNACDAVTCPPDWVCKGGECIDARCIGVICPADQFCYQGVCLRREGCGLGTGGGAGGGSAGGTAGGGAAGGSAGGGSAGGGAAGGSAGGGAVGVTGTIQGVAVVWNRCDLQPVPGAVVSTPGAASVVTDLNGRFRLDQVPLSNAAVVTVRVARGSPYVPVAHAVVAVLAGTTSHVMLRLFALCTDTQVLSTASSAMFLGNLACQPTGLGAGVTYGDLTWRDGGVYDGVVTMSYASLQYDPLGDGGFDLSGLAALPGRGTGLDATDAGVSLETLGATWVEFIDNASSERLLIAPGHTIPLQIPAALDVALPPQPRAWWFDGTVGQWRDDGPAPAVDDAGTAFGHAIAAPGWWAAQRPIPGTACAEGTVTDGANPVAGADVRFIGVDQGWFGAATTDNAGRFCIQAPPNANVAGIARVGDPSVGAVLDPYAIRVVSVGNAQGVSCSVGVGGCTQLGSVALVTPPRACVYGALHDAPRSDGGLPPISDDVYYSADVAIMNEYRRSLCQSSRVRLSGMHSAVDGGFCVAGPPNTTFRLGNDTPPYTCRPIADPQFDAGSTTATCGGAGCVDVGPQWWYCNS